MHQVPDWDRHLGLHPCEGERVGVVTKGLPERPAGQVICPKVVEPAQKPFPLGEGHDSNLGTRTSGPQRPPGVSLPGQDVRNIRKHSDSHFRPISVQTSFSNFSPLLVTFPLRSRRTVVVSGPQGTWTSVSIET